MNFIKWEGEETKLPSLGKQDMISCMFCQVSHSFLDLEIIFPTQSTTSTLKSFIQ